MNLLESKTPAHPALIILAVVGGLGMSSFRYAFTSSPDDLWFQVRVIENKQPVIVKLGADWCGACRAIDPELKQLRNRFVGQLDIVEIDIEEKRHLAQHYGVRSIPRLLLFHDGRLKKSRTGYASQQELLNWAKPYMNSVH